MFGKRITLFKLFGFEVHVDLSWAALALLITWSLAKGLFPQHYPGYSSAAYWWMGAAGAVGMFISIVFHEMFHSLVARRFGLPMKGITLFIFGGVAEMDDEPPSPKAEFWMAIVGPLSSIVLGGVFFVAGSFVGSSAVSVSAVLGYLAVINWVLAGFNLLPAFPLDGGRVLRSGLWKWKNDLRKATHIASQIGAGFGIFIIFLGVLNVLRGNFIGGLWQFMIGMFLRSAAEMSYRQILIKQALGGATVSQVMSRDPAVVSPSLSIRELVEDHVYRRHYKLFPVIRDERLAGCITVERIKEIPRDEWDRRTVGEVVSECSGLNTIEPDADVLKALSRMRSAATGRLMVVENGRLVGIISRKDIMDYMSLKMDLQEDHP
jgi:Zn-dependent protease/predicted transcriptional regulator